ncbi:hypothetical protein PHISCL_09344 [Aspergillus sclerotialis]|uniref:Rhodopsin domain-containing protein n=1 Tax=Aspergillus sclerotialis TaxID=2070753 RepID=A0A3A2ZAJ9_9EURO|nr:hypothetical protein PHISCL_09344 [Aspergillus sclerotialis]
MAEMTGSSNDAGVALLRDTWGLTSTALVIIALRVAAKLRVQKFGWDDILMIFAQIFLITGTAMITAGVKYGLGRHTSDISKSDASTVIQYDYLAQTFGIAASYTGRLAFAIYIVGILGVQGIHRIALWALMCAQLATNLISILIMFLQCPGHGSAIWNWPQGGGCWHPRVQAYYGYFAGCKKRSDKSFVAIWTNSGWQTAFNSATDVYLAALPTHLLWKLNIKWSAKFDGGIHYEDHQGACPVKAR